LNYNNNPIPFVVKVDEEVENNRVKLRVQLDVTALRLNNTSATFTTLYQNDFLDQQNTASTISDAVVSSLYNYVSDPEAYRKEIERVPSVTIYHPLYSFTTKQPESKYDEWKKFSEKNVGKDLGYSPTLLTGVGQGRVFVGKTKLRKNANLEKTTGDLVVWGHASFLTVMQLAHLLMSNTGFRSTVRPRYHTDLFERMYRDDTTRFFGSERYRQLFLPQNYNRLIEPSKLRPISDEFEKAVLLYLKKFPELYGLDMKFAEKEYTMLTFKTKVRNGKSFIPMKKP
jgi:hypothetical protein